jgi:peptide/nickel transport system permease protein
MDIGLALGGAIFTESIFELPGLGRQLIQAYTVFDLPIIAGVITFSTFAVIVFNFLVDITYGFLDPRIRVT